MERWKKVVDWLSSTLTAGMECGQTCYEAVTKRLQMIASWIAGIAMLAAFFFVIGNISSNPVAWSKYMNASAPGKLINMVIYVVFLLALDGGSRGHTIRAIMEKACDLEATWEDRGVAAGFIGIIMIGAAWTLNAN